jgi:hypothetical protein
VGEMKKNRRESVIKCLKLELAIARDIELEMMVQSS